MKKHILLLYKKAILSFLILFASATAYTQTDSCTFTEADGILTVEMESTKIAGTYWVEKNEITDYTGTGYIEYQGGDATGIPGRSEIAYTFKITNPGRYSFKARAYRTTHYDNDVWVRFPQGGVMTKINGDSSGSKDDEWFKFMIGEQGNWAYFMKTQYAGTPGETLHDVYVDFPEPGVYTVQFAGRATGFKLDRFTLYSTSGFYGMNPDNPESSKENCQSYTNTGPYIANPPVDQTVEGGTSFSFTLPENTFMHPNGDGLGKVALLKGYHPLPDWLTFDASTMTFSGTVIHEDGGPYDIIIKAQDSEGLYVIAGFRLSVAGNNPPVVSNELEMVYLLPNSNLEMTFPENTFTDPDGDVLVYTSYKISGSALPAWLSFDAAQRTFSGTPAVSDIGSDTIVIVADDNNGGSVQTEFVIYVAHNSLPVRSIPIADQTGQTDNPFQFSFPVNAFSDSDGDKLIYSAAMNNGDPLPAWISFDRESRNFSCTPGNNDAGTYPVVIAATDNIAGYAYDTLVIEIQSATGIFGASKNSGTIINVFPNPADDHVFIKCKGSKKKSHIEVLSNTGVVMLVKELSGYETDVRISFSDKDFPPGIYLVNIFTDDGEKSSSILLKK